MDCKGVVYPLKAGSNPVAGTNINRGRTMYSSLASYLNAHYTIDNDTTQRREVYSKTSNILIAFIPKSLVDALQKNVDLKVQVLKHSGMLTLSPWRI